MMLFPVWFREVYIFFLIYIFLKVTSLENKNKRLIRRLRRDDCASNPCNNGGTCTNIYNGFFCQCPDNWEGKEFDRLAKPKPTRKIESVNKALLF